MKRNNKELDFLECYWGAKSASLLGSALAGKKTVATRQRQGLVTEGDWVFRPGNGLIKAADGFSRARQDFQFSIILSQILKYIDIIKMDLNSKVFFTKYIT